MVKEYILVPQWKDSLWGRVSLYITVTFPSFCVVVGLYVCVFQEMASWHPKAADWSAPSLSGALTPPSRQWKQLSLQLPTPSPA